MWIVLLTAIVMPVLAGVLLLRVQMNGRMHDDSDSSYAGRCR
jgi:hypothetical protein